MADALNDALVKRGTPEIFETDLRSQFTVSVWINLRDDVLIEIGTWQDNRMIERLRRSITYECVYFMCLNEGPKRGRHWEVASLTQRRPSPFHPWNIALPSEAYERKIMLMKMQPE